MGGREWKKGAAPVGKGRLGRWLLGLGGVARGGTTALGAWRGGTAGVREPGTTATAEKRRWRHEEETASALSAGLCPAELRPASVVEGGRWRSGRRQEEAVSVVGDLVTAFIPAR
ncbi:uncharacterized protein LOC127754074 [Oryza glaberrima]|uniref:Uncharacterized protein n=1 Tax=Oryza glaberrima TaxID=4538 RepID=I1QZP4_ORYGL|nr:uncharacterized protein LOC127754074 [Oryza glaberrima]